MVGEVPEVHKDAEGGYRFRLEAGNTKVVATRRP